MSAHDEQHAADLREKLMYAVGLFRVSGNLDPVSDAVDAYEAFALRATPETGSCAWTQDDDDGWDGSCGASWVFESHGPVENHVTYCPTCGKLLQIIEVPHAED